MIVTTIGQDVVFAQCFFNSVIIIGDHEVIKIMLDPFFFAFGMDLIIFQAQQFFLCAVWTDCMKMVDFYDD